MTQKLPMFLALAAWLTIFTLAAQDAWQVLDIQANGLPKQRMSWNVSDTFLYTPLTEEEQSRGFRVTAIDINYNWKKQFTWPQPTLDDCIRLVAARGDYTIGSFGIFIARELAELEISATSLIAKDGTFISDENIHFLQIAPWESTPRFQYTQMLWKPELTSLQGNEMVPIVVMIAIPKETPGDLYEGNILIKADGKETALQIALRVADFELPAAGIFGFYLNGNFYRPMDYYDCNQKTFVPENLRRYFAFYKTRRFNSVSLYDNLPDLRLVDGKVTGNFSDASAIAQAMNDCGLANASIFFDLRDIGYWCYACAEKLAELGDAPIGDLGVTMAQRKRAEQVGERYPKRAKELYAEAIRLLLAQAAAEHWPEIHIFADEELGNQFTLKINNYESYMPVIMATAPEHAVVIDNGIGWGRNDCIEYGRRDNVKFRQYNSWTDEALERAKTDGASIMTFNYAATRLSYGFTQVRCRSLGHHQWADLWDASNYQWQFSRLSEQGVVTSLAMEYAHEGCVDYAACSYLRQLGLERAEAGDFEAAAYAETVLSQVADDLSVDHRTAQNYAFLFTNADLNTRRWKVFQAIEKLLGHSVQNAVTDGSPTVWIEPSHRAPMQKASCVLTIRNNKEHLMEQPEAVENFWSDYIGPLTHLTEYETQLRAFYSNEDEFRKHNQPSYSVARLASLPEGLAITTDSNHVMPQKPFRFERKDDDGELWQDDCWEFFFGLPNNKRCHLIVNSAGAKTFFDTGEIISAKDIVCYSKSPMNEYGGTTQKLLVPWKYFGLAGQPRADTTWGFNAARRMHTFRTEKEAPMTWARLATSFHEQDKWGRLVFTNDDHKTIHVKPTMTVEPNIAHVFTSGQHIRFNVETQSDLQTILTLKGELRDAAGHAIALPEQTLPNGASVLVLKTDGMKLGEWQLVLQLSGQPVQESNVMTFSLLPTPWN